MARHLMFGSSQNVVMASLSLEPGEVACLSSLGNPGVILLLLTLSVLPLLQRELHSRGCGSAAGAQVAGDVQ